MEGVGNREWESFLYEPAGFIKLCPPVQHTYSTGKATFVSIVRQGVLIEH